VRITHVRNATMVIEVADRRILVDPMLGAKGAYPAAPVTFDHVGRRNPTVELTVPLQDLLDVDLAVVTHTHDDHWDAAAAALLPRHLPILVQDESDAATIAAQGFTEVRVMAERTTIGGSTFSRTDGRHGSEEVLAAWPALGAVSGFVLRHPGEPVLYVAGDTVWNEHVAAALQEHRPDVVVLNAGDARLVDGARIIMDADDVHEVHAAAPDALIVATHLEALNLTVLTRGELRKSLAARGIAHRVAVPEDGEVLAF
jgi:L-ascorbate metabolism protein UlaG (beta-lactamase superfamily)